MKILLLANILLILGCNLLALEFATAYTYGLILLVLVNSLFLSRKYRFLPSLGYNVLAITLYIASKYLINFIGDYHIVLDNGDFLPITIQITVAISEWIMAIMLSNIINGIIQLYKHMRRRRTLLDSAIEQIGQSSER